METESLSTPRVPAKVAAPLSQFPAAAGVCLFFASTTEGNPSAGGSVLMPALGISEKFLMTPRHLSSICKKYLGLIFVISGVFFWMLVIAVPRTPLHLGLASLGHVEK